VPVPRVPAIHVRRVGVGIAGVVVVGLVVGFSCVFVLVTSLGRFVVPKEKVPN
jgi:hypothetical protein